MEGPGPGTGRALILAIETSCDETAAAVVSDEGEIRSNVVSSQAHLHARFGGVVPEVASRHHLELVLPVMREALGDGGLDEIDRVEILEPGVRALERLGDDGGHQLEMPPGGDFRDDSAVASVQIGLRGDDVREDTTLERIDPPSTSAAAVSSQLVSRPRIRSASPAPRPGPSTL